jgi:TolB-like protein/tetratricopeptide (TPR) repeat protein
MSDAIAVFGPFSLDRSGKVLLRDGEPVEAGQRGVALAKALIAARGSTVTKSELMDAAWPDVVVDEGNLTVQIAALRKALGTTPDGDEWIVTVPRVGYRLAISRPVAAVPPPQATNSVSRHPMLAVLPFQNLSGDPEQEYFADGVVEDIIAAMSRFRSFAVVARTSSFAYKGRAVDVREVCRELSVRYVLGGSVRRSGSRLRITAQLVEGENGAHLWAKTFDGPAEDVFAFQDLITAEVATIVHPRIEQAEIERVRRKPPESLDAYDLILRALPSSRTGTPETNAEAIRLFMRAMELDPGYALAISYAASTLGIRWDRGWPSLTGDDFSTCIALTRRAVELANGDALILAQCGLTLAFIAAEYEEGLALVDLAVAGNPNNSYVMAYAANAYLHCSDLLRGLEYAHQAVDLQPGRVGAFFPLTIIAHCHMALGNFEEALGWAERALAANANFEPAHWMLISASAKLGRMDEARRWVARFLMQRPEISIAVIRRSQPTRYADRNANIYEGLAAAGVPKG